MKNIKFGYSAVQKRMSDQYAANYLEIGWFIGMI